MFKGTRRAVIEEVRFKLALLSHSTRRAVVTARPHHHHRSTLLLNSTDLQEETGRIILNRTRLWSVRLITAAAVLLSQIASAGTVQVTSQLGSIQTLGYGSGAPGNYDVRIYLINGGTICSGYNWAYINITDANYQSLVSNLLTAKSAGSTVIWDVTPDSGTGYCHLNDMTIQ